MLEQESAPAHRPCEMVEFLAQETLDFSPMLLSADTINIFHQRTKIKLTIEAR